MSADLDLIQRLRDPEEPNALIVRRRAADALERAWQENQRLREALAAYRSALRSGERESAQLREVGDAALAAAPAPAAATLPVDAEALERARMLAFEAQLDYSWHEYAIADPFDTEARVHELTRAILDAIGAPSHVRVYPAAATPADEETALAAVRAERRRQEQRKAEGRFEFTCADDGLTNSEKLTILAEEVGEVAQEVLTQDGRRLARDTVGTPEALLAEVVQVAAVATAWVEGLQRKVGRGQ